MIKASIFSGVFYSKKKQELEQQLQSLFDEVSIKRRDLVRGVIAPHAGYIYSGKQAAEAFASIKYQKFKTAVILGPSHHHYFKGLSVYPGEGYETPLGTILCDKENIEILQRINENIHYIEEAHSKEHSIEVELPFLYYINPGVKIVPIIVGDMEIAQMELLAQQIERIWNKEDSVIIASTDFSHF